MSREPRKQRFEEKEKLRPEANAQYKEWTKTCIRVADEESRKEGASSAVARRMRGVFGVPPHDAVQGPLLRPTTQLIFNRLTAEEKAEHVVYKTEDYLKEALKKVKADVVSNFQLYPAAHKVQGEIISCLRVGIRSDGSKFLYNHVPITRGSPTTQQQVRTPAPPTDLGGGGAAVDTEATNDDQFTGDNTEEGDDDDAALDNAEADDADDENDAANIQTTPLQTIRRLIPETSTTINTGHYDETLKYLTSEITEQAQSLMEKELKEKSIEWTTADRLARNIMLEGVLDGRQFLSYSTAKELRIALEKYANVTGVGVLTNVMILQDTFLWKWTASETVHHNTHALDEQIDRYHRSTMQFIDEKSRVGQSLSIAKDALKVTLLIARSYDAFKEPYESVSAQEQIKDIFKRNQDNFHRIYTELSAMLHQWRSTRRLTSGDRASSTYEKKGKSKKSNKKKPRCDLCHYSGHTAEECQAKNDKEECKRRRIKVQEANIRAKNKKKEIANKVSNTPSQSESASKEATPSNAEKNTIKKLVENGLLVLNDNSKGDGQSEKLDTKWADCVSEYYNSIR